MNYTIRTVLVFLILISTACADKLEITVNSKKIDLPHWSAQKEQNGAVIFINGGEQAHWSALLANLAKKLSKNGWSVALLNCNEGNPEPWIKELPEAVNALRQQKNKRIVIVHYGEQLKQIMESISKTPAGIDGFILLSAYDLPAPAPAPAPASSAADAKKQGLRLPVFDITGQFDYELVREQATLRESDFGQNKYLAIQIPGAYHDYEYSRQLLTSFLHGWMLKLAEFKPVPAPVSYIESIAPLMPKLVALDDESDWTGFNEDPPEPTQEIMTQ